MDHIYFMVTLTIQSELRVRVCVHVFASQAAYKGGKSRTEKQRPVQTKPHD